MVIERGHGDGKHLSDLYRRHATLGLDGGAGADGLARRREIVDIGAPDDGGGVKDAVTTPAGSGAEVGSEQRPVGFHLRRRGGGVYLATRTGERMRRHTHTVTSALLALVLVLVATPPPASARNLSTLTGAHLLPPSRKSRRLTRGCCNWRKRRQGCDGARRRSRKSSADSYGLCTISSSCSTSERK